MKTDLPQRDSAGADGFVVVPSVSDALPLRERVLHWKDFSKSVVLNWSPESRKSQKCI